MPRCEKRIEAFNVEHLHRPKEMSDPFFDKIDPLGAAMIVIHPTSWHKGRLKIQCSRPQAFGKVWH